MQDQPHQNRNLLVKQKIIKQAVNKQAKPDFVIFVLMEIDFGKPLQINTLKSKTKFDEEVIAFLKDWYSKGETVEVQTSGSTGKPKRFQIEKERMLNSAKLTCDFLNLKPDDSALLCLPVQYISGKMMVVRSLLRRLKLCAVSPSTTPLDGLNKDFNFCAMTPLQVENSLSQINQLQKLIIGGAAVSDHLKHELKGKTTTIYETYGMSETLSHIALKELNPKEESYFTVFEGIEISTDERNCLKINALQLNSKILQTNDVVEISDPKHFRFLGRADNVINSGGAKIYPEVLEEIVKKQIGREVVFLGLKDEIYGDKLTLVIEDSILSTTEVFEKDNLPENSERKVLFEKILTIPFEKSFHRPKTIIFLPKIPRTPNGKISRIELYKLCVSLALNKTR